MELRRAQEEVLTEPDQTGAEPVQSHGLCGEQEAKMLGFQNKSMQPELSEGSFTDKMESDCESGPVLTRPHGSELTDGTVAAMGIIRTEKPLIPFRTRRWKPEALVLCRENT